MGEGGGGGVKANENVASLTQTLCTRLCNHTPLLGWFFIFILFLFPQEDVVYSGLQLTFLSIFRRGGGKFQVADPTVVVGSPDP